jgi:hypothetical protein
MREGNEPVGAHGCAPTESWTIHACIWNLRPTPHPALSRRERVWSLDVTRMYLEHFDVRRGEPSPSGRGQGEGSNVDSSSAVIGLEGSAPSSVRFSGDMVTKCIVAPGRVAPRPSFHPAKRRFMPPLPTIAAAAVKCSIHEKRARAVGRARYLRTGMDSSAPVPIAAKENVTFDPSPCPLPEGEGSPPLARESSKSSTVTSKLQALSRRERVLLAHTQCSEYIRVCKRQGVHRCAPLRANIDVPRFKATVAVNRPCFLPRPEGVWR